MTILGAGANNTILGSVDATYGGFYSEKLDYLDTKATMGGYLAKTGSQLGQMMKIVCFTPFLEVLWRGFRPHISLK